MKKTTEDPLAAPVPKSSSFGCLHDLLALRAQRAPDAVAIAAPGRASLSYAGLHRHVGDTVRSLRDLGVGRNDRVAIVLPNGPEMATAFLGVAAAANAAALSRSDRQREFGCVSRDLKRKALVVPAGDESPARAGARVRRMPLIELSPVPDGE